jgi:hypothetical protein
MTTSGRRWRRDELRGSEEGERVAPDGERDAGARGRLPGHAAAQYKGRVPEGEPLFPAMTTDAVYFAGEYVVYGEIAALVMMVWELAAIGIQAVSTGTA